MAVPNSGDAPRTATPDPPAQATTSTQATAPAKGPYDDLLCTICNLKACWMTPEAAGKGAAGEQPQATG